MAKSQQRLKGTIGDVTFYKSKKNGYLAREKSDINPGRIKNDPAFQRTRENNAEFGTACKASKLIRTAFRSMLKNLSDTTAHTRLVQQLMVVLKADTTNARGSRNVMNGNLALLQGFNFNVISELNSVFYPLYTSTVNRASGQITVTVPGFTPNADVLVPPGTTHFRLVAGSAEINFMESRFVFSAQNSPDIPFNDTAVAAFDLQLTLPANSTQKLLLAFGIEFYQMVNGKLSLLKDATYNSLSLLNAE